MHIVLLLLIAIAAAQEFELTCRDHPAYQPSWKPPLLRSWKQFENPSNFEKLLYAPRHFVKYHPSSNPRSTKYHGTDLLLIGGGRAKEKLARLYLNRPATVYLFIGIKREGRQTTLKGWKSEGYVRIADKSKSEVPYGVYQKGILKLPPKAYVFSKKVTSVIDIPSEKTVYRTIGLPHTVRSHIRLAEFDGRPTRQAGTFQGRAIRPNTRCPAALHRAWVAKHKDTKDRQVRGRVFGTWHPVWDPCFWCTYGHDHGSNPKGFMGYEPTFDYAALKNNFEDESHQGFKGFAFKMGRYRVYYNLHAQTSRLRRIKERWHTTVIAVVDDKGKLMAELTQKADFGFLAARGSRVGFVPLRPIDKKIMESQNLNLGQKRLRTVNVINTNKLDRRFRFQRGSSVTRGVYEAWVTGVMCGLARRTGELTVDFKEPISGVKSVKELGTIVRLRKTTRNVGLNREFKMDLRMGLNYCQFKNGKTKGGTFYTDPKGERLVKGPAPGAVRQYFNPSFRAHLHGKFEVVETGRGLFVDGERGLWTDVGYGIDPEAN